MRRSVQVDPQILPKLDANVQIGQYQIVLYIYIYLSLSFSHFISFSEVCSHEVLDRLRLAKKHLSIAEIVFEICYLLVDYEALEASTVCHKCM